MLGAIAGDVIGSSHEGDGPVPADSFPLFDERSRFTDDTVLTVAIASALRRGLDYRDAVLTWGRRYPWCGFSMAFHAWLHTDDPPRRSSAGNGAAMRVAAVGWAFPTLERVLEHAARTAVVSHDHPDGIGGAQAVAAAVFVMRMGGGKAELESLLATRFGYDCRGALQDRREHPRFDMTCAGTVPVAVGAFLESADWESAVRGAIAVGGDTDTQACIAGAIAEASYGGTPMAVQRDAMRRLDEPLRQEALACARAFEIPIGVESR